jgi:RNA polymerase sigma-70 factor, ECF subfamily
MSLSSPDSLLLPSLAEVELVSRIRAGDREAMSIAYRRYSGSLLSLATRLTGSATDAEDVVQDLFVGLPHALQRYQEWGHLLPWLRRIAVRLVLMRLRARKKRREADLGQAGEMIEPGQIYSDGAALAEALDQLPDEHRAIVVLKTIEGYSHEEIGRMLGIRRNTSEVRLHRALHRLRELLEES